jgi:hypothetical protein
MLATTPDQPERVVQQPEVSVVLRSPMLLLAWLTGAVAIASAHATTAAPRSAVTTSLDGKKVLPHRIHWLAYPKLTQGHVKEVDFLIDGELRWIERKAPYTYGDNGNWLVTSWLTPGVHRFAVRVVTTRGETVAANTIDARVLPAPAPPAQLDHTAWRLNVTTGRGPHGTWTLSIDRTGWRIGDPVGGRNYIDVAYLGSSLLETRGGIWTHLHNDQGGNGWCEDTNAPVRFRWSLAGGSLVLKRTGPSRCDGLGAFLTNTWMKGA